MKTLKSLTASLMLGAVLFSGAAPASASPSAATTPAAASVAHTTVKQSTVQQSMLHTSKKGIKKRTKSALHVRPTPNMKKKSIATLKKHTTVTITRSKSGWAYITAGKHQGWVVAKHLQNIPKKSTKTASSKKTTAKKTTSSIKKRTTTNLNMRSGASTKHKRVATLKKHTQVTVTRSKSGWSYVTAGKRKGWVSSKYLQNIPKKSTAKKSTKKASSKIKLSQVNTYAKAQRFLKESCPRVKIQRISGTYSHYNPNTRTISIANAHYNGNRMGWVFVHELSHHYQWEGYYKTRSSQWNRDIKNKKLEIQADHMASHITGKTQGHYTKKKATGKQATAVKDMINKGKRAGC